MTAAVFLGPTLPRARARAALDAVYLPPVQQGDVLRALERSPRAIAIIDGYFDRVPSVWHKEILVALEAGVWVFGAASMGALRAAELHDFGMVGVGEIFAAYRDGELEDDDEVAVAHGGESDDYVELSLAMVNVRDLARAAVDGRMVEATHAAHIVEVAKQIHYADRTFAALRARVDGAAARDAVDRLQGLAARAPSLKQRDALALLDHVARWQAGDPPPFEASFRTHRTVFLDALESEVRLERWAGEVPDAGELAQLTATGESLAFARRKVLLRILAAGELDRLGVEVSDAEAQRMTDRFRAANGLATAADTLAWMQEVGLTVEALDGMMRSFAGMYKLDELYAREVDRLLPDHLRFRPPRLWRQQRARARGGEANG